MIIKAANQKPQNSIDNWNTRKTPHILAYFYICTIHIIAISNLFVSSNVRLWCILDRFSALYYPEIHTRAYPKKNEWTNFFFCQLELNIAKMRTCVVLLRSFCVSIEFVGVHETIISHLHNKSIDLVELNPYSRIYRLVSVRVVFESRRLLYIRRWFVHFRNHWYQKCTASHRNDKAWCVITTSMIKITRITTIGGGGR